MIWQVYANHIPVIYQLWGFQMSGYYYDTLWHFQYFISIMTLLWHYYCHYNFYKSQTIIAHYDKIRESTIISLMTVLLLPLLLLQKSDYYCTLAFMIQVEKRSRRSQPRPGPAAVPWQRPRRHWQVQKTGQAESRAAVTGWLGSRLQPDSRSEHFESWAEPLVNWVTDSRMFLQHVPPEYNSNSTKQVLIEI